MKTIMDELKSVPAKKHIVTSIEYDCRKSDKTEEVFDVVRDIVTDHLDEIAKITYDINNADQSVKVEITQNA
jgi:hypothetical protein